MNNQPFLAIQPEARRHEGFPVGREREVMDAIRADDRAGEPWPVTGVPDLKPEFPVVGDHEFGRRVNKQSARSARLAGSGPFPGELPPAAGKGSPWRSVLCCVSRSIGPAAGKSRSGRRRIPSASTTRAAKEMRATSMIIRTYFTKTTIVAHRPAMGRWWYRAIVRSNCVRNDSNGQNAPDHPAMSSTPPKKIARAAALSLLADKTMEENSSMATPETRLNTP